MKERLPVSLPVYVVLQEGILRGTITKSMNRGQYTVQTFLGSVTANETKIFKRSDFINACKLYEKLYGAR
jgi:hypothetical protein